MTNRGERFTVLLGGELKGAITARGYTAAAVADAFGHSKAAFSNWLNGVRQLPTHVYENACEFIGIEPQDLVERAYKRLLDEQGPYTGPVVKTSVPEFILTARDADDEAESEAQAREP